jgi:hypothetical protein
MPPKRTSLEYLRDSYYETISGIKLDQLSNYDEFDDPNVINPSILVHKRKKQKSKTRPLTSHGTLNAYLGLNQSHVPLVICTIEAWHNDVLHNGYQGIENAGYWGNLGVSMGVTILSPWAVIPITLYVLLSLWNARAVIQKNIIYNENRIRYLNALQAYKKGKDLELQSIITEDLFNEAHQALLEFNDTQLTVNPPKSFFRAALIFGILFVSILPASWPIFLLTAICAAIVTRADYVAQRSEINKDLAIKKLQWELITTEKEYIDKLLADASIQRILKEKNINFSLIRITEQKLDKRFVYTDHFFTVIGMNSGYLAFSLITLFSLHQVLPVALVFFGLSYSLAFLVLFGLPALACIAIGTYHAMQNQKLYDFFEIEINRLQLENAQYQADLKHLGFTEDFKDLVFLTQHTKELNAINKESKWSVKIFEAGKKVVRPWQFFGLFGLLSVILFSGLATGPIAAIIGLIVVVSLIMGYADYKTREYKETLEGEINTLKENQINLLEKKSTLLTQYKSAVTPHITIPTNNDVEVVTPQHSPTDKSKSSSAWSYGKYAAAGAGVVALSAAALYLPNTRIARNVSQIRQIFHK